MHDTHVRAHAYARFINSYYSKKNDLIISKIFEIIKLNFNKWTKICILLRNSFIFFFRK